MLSPNMAVLLARPSVIRNDRRQFVLNVQTVLGVGVPSRNPRNFRRSQFEPGYERVQVDFVAPPRWTEPRRLDIGLEGFMSKRSWPDERGIPNQGKPGKDLRQLKLSPPGILRALGAVGRLLRVWCCDDRRTG